MTVGWEKLTQWLCKLAKWKLPKWKLAKWKLPKWKLAKWKLLKWKLAKWKFPKCKLEKWKLPTEKPWEKLIPLFSFPFLRSEAFSIEKTTLEAVVFIVVKSFKIPQNRPTNTWEQFFFVFFIRAETFQAILGVYVFVNITVHFYRDPVLHLVHENEYYFECSIHKKNFIRPLFLLCKNCIYCRS